MLVLTRKKGESLMIGDQIEVVVLSIEGEAVKIGLQAPKNVEIYRKEVYRAIQNANKEAVSRRVNVTELGKWLRNQD